MTTVAVSSKPEKTQPRPWWMTMIWVAAVWGLIGGVLLVVQAFRVKNA